LLRVTLTANIPVSAPNDVIDLMITPGTGPFGYEYSGGGVEQRLSLNVTAGVTYRIRVNSYPYLLPQPATVDFELRTEM